MQTPITFDLAPYRLTLNREPFILAVYRDDQLRLQSTPHDEPVTHWQPHEHGVQVTFPSSTLSITIADGAIDVHWRSIDHPQAALSTQRSALSNRGDWYGQGELIHQRWPLDRVMQPETDLITCDNGPTGLLCIQTPAWLSSNGCVVLAHSPVRCALNQSAHMRAQSDWDLGAGQAPFDQRPAIDPGHEGDGLLSLDGANLHFEILLADDLPTGYRQLVKRLSHPGGIPPIGLFTHPTWTTWARYKTAIDQEIVLNFAHEIIEHGYPYHVLEIDDIWQTHYGNLEFASDRFPDPKGLIDQLHALGFKVTAWVIPFINPDAAAFHAGAANGYLVQTAAGDPYLVKWWQGEGALLDATHPDALNWFLTRLYELQQKTGLDGFKFDAGEAIFLPEDAVWLGRSQGFAPTRNDYTHHYVDFVARNFGLTEVRSGWFNQSAPIFFRQWDKTSDWSYANGLKSVITGLLSLSLTGYPFILPDMIGGNAYHETPDAELMIRWTQLTALLPALQFSIAPWDFGEECDRVCRRYVELHIEFAPEILRLAEEAARTGEPIIRPVFWLAPHDERALRCDDEFLLGDDVLVAPVVEAGQRARDIYLPPGVWRDHWTGQVVEGPIVLSDHPAPLETLPIFQRQSKI